MKATAKKQEKTKEREQIEFLLSRQFKENS